MKLLETLEEFVKQRRTRKENSLEAALYPIIKKFVFSEVGLDSLQNTTTYSELKAKKKIIKVRILEDSGIISKKVELMDIMTKRKRYQYETVDYGTLYLNSLPTIIRDKFTATTKK